MDRLWLGCELYWTIFVNGRFAVRHELNEDENETVFTGSYKECSDYLEKLRVKYEDSLY